MKLIIVTHILWACFHGNNITSVASPINSSSGQTGENNSTGDRGPTTRDQSDDLTTFLDDFANKYTDEAWKFKKPRWDYLIDKTDSNWKLFESGAATFRTYVETVRSEDKECDTASTPEDKRKCNLIKQYGIFNLNEAEMIKYEQTRKSLLDAYFNATIEDYQNNTNHLNLTEIRAVMASSNDFHELEYYWSEFRNVFTEEMKDDFESLAKMSNTAAENHKKDYSTTTYWKEVSEYPSVMNDLKTYAKELNANYELLYSYVRLKLSQRYPGKVSKYGKIPEFLTGDLLGSNWENLFDVLAFEDGSLNIDDKIKKKWKKVPEMLEDIAKTIGIDGKMNSKLHVLEYDYKKNMDCLPIVDDLSTKTSTLDYKLKICGEVSINGFAEMFQELAKLDYFIAYGGTKAPPFRQISSDVLLESYSRAVSLYGISEKNLLEMNVIQSPEKVDEFNFLLRQALKTFPTLMYSLAVEEWRETFYESDNLNDFNTKTFVDTVAKRMKFEIQPETVFPQAAVLEVLLNKPLYPSAIGEVLKYEILDRFCENKISYDCTMPKTNLQTHKINLLVPGAEKGWRDLLLDDNINLNINDLKIKKYFTRLFEKLEKILKDDCLTADCEQVFEKTFSEFNKTAAKAMNEMVKSDWDYKTNMNPSNEASSVEASESYSSVMKSEAKKFQDIGYQNIPDSDKRLYEKITFLGYSALNDTGLRKDKSFENYLQLRTSDESSFLNTIQANISSTEESFYERMTFRKYSATDNGGLKKFKAAVAKMSSMYSTAKICPYYKQDCDLDKDGLELSKDLEPKMASLRNYEELQYIWEKWRDAVGPKCREPFKIYLKEGQKIADANNLPTLAEVWQFEYEEQYFQYKMKKQWEKIEPLYQKLHAYVRHKLLEKYPGKFNSKDPIPAHILGNMWAQDWAELYEDLKPHEGVMNISIQRNLENLSKDNPKYLFTMAEDFFSSVGMQKMTQEFYSNSILVQPPNTKMVCHASAWDFYEHNDFRIKMCTQISEAHFKTVHHEMGHVEYFMAYKDLSVPFRTGANPAFHEAVGDTISLSVMNPIHLKKVKLLDGDKYSLTDKKNRENYLMKKALEKLPLLPFAYIVDLWRWDLFKNVSDTREMNKKWWKLREKYQGVKPPVYRSEEDFDPAAKYHISNDVPYIRYFFSGILQFQFHKILAKNNDLVEYVMDKTAGSRFWKMLTLGASKHWKEVLGQLDGTGSSDLDADGIVEYFKDLDSFLTTYLQDNKVEIGWNSVIEKYFKTETPKTPNHVPAIVGGIVGPLLVMVIGVFIYKRTRK